MKASIVFLVGLLTTPFSVHAEQPDANKTPTPAECAARTHFFQNIKGKEMNLNEATQWLTSQHSQVIILGEMHSSPAYDFEPMLIRELVTKDRKIDCLFLEVQSENQNEAQELKDGDSSDFGGIGEWEMSASKARSMGVKVYFVDDQSPSSLPTPYMKVYGQWMEYRNQVMSERIAQLIKTGTCQAGIAINGKEHLLEDFQATGFHSLQSMIRGHGVSTRTVNLQDYFRPDFDKQIGNLPGVYARSADADPSWNWKGCDLNPYSGNKRIAFKNSDGTNVPFMFSIGFGGKYKVGHWSDFDLTILLP